MDGSSMIQTSGTYGKTFHIVLAFVMAFAMMSLMSFAIADQAFADDGTVFVVADIDGVNGTIAPSGRTEYEPNETPTYTMTPNVGYCIDTIKVVDVARFGATEVTLDHDVDAGDYVHNADGSASYTFGGLTSYGRISVRFERDANNDNIPDFKEIAFTYVIPNGVFSNGGLYHNVEWVDEVNGNRPSFRYKKLDGTMADVPTPEPFPGYSFLQWDWNDGGQVVTGDTVYKGIQVVTITARPYGHVPDVFFQTRLGDYSVISGETWLNCISGQPLGDLPFPDVRSADIPVSQWPVDKRTVSQFIGWYDVNVDAYVPGTAFSPVPATTTLESFVATNNANIAAAKTALKDYVPAGFSSCILEARFQRVDIQYPSPVITLTRLFGDDRISTAKAIADNALVTNTAPENAIIVATAANFPDALTGASLAGAYNADIVLTDTDTLSAECRQVLESSTASKVFILGGTGAVSESVESRIRAIKPDTTRLGGADRMATAELIADCVTDTAHASSSTDTCVIAAAANFPDALSASAYAAYTSSPIFLTAFDGKSISATTVAKIKFGGYKNVIVVGGETAVDANVINQVKDFGISSVTRLGGADRYDTSARIADFEMNAGIGMSYDRCGIATGERFPDALCGGAMQGRDGSVILLTSTDSLSDSCANVLTANKNIFREIRFFGGTSAVSENVIRAVVDCRAAPHITWHPTSAQLF